MQQLIPSLVLLVVLAAAHSTLRQLRRRQIAGRLALVVLLVLAAIGLLALGYWWRLQEGDADAGPAGLRLAEDMPARLGAPLHLSWRSGTAGLRIHRAEETLLVLDLDGPEPVAHLHAGLRLLRARLDAAGHRQDLDLLCRTRPPLPAWGALQQAGAAHGFQLAGAVP
ncbi:MAG: hypothetical protein ACOCXJ_03385 [Planctomycetota bacterium]